MLVIYLATLARRVGGPVLDSGARTPFTTPVSFPSLSVSHLFAFSAYFVLKERDPLLRGDSSFHPDRQTKRSRGRVARINSPSLVPSLVPILSPSASGHSPAISGTGQGFGTFFLSSRECFPRARSFQTSIREGEREKRRRRIRKDTFSSVGKTRWLVSLVRKEGGNLRKFFVLPLLANPNPAVAEENDVIAGRSRWERRFR